MYKFESLQVTWIKHVLEVSELSIIIFVIQNFGESKWSSPSIFINRLTACYC